MELRHLRYFLAVARHRNFTRAAQELHLAQPPLSQQIQQLEQELGVQLFDRGGRQVHLTPAGEELQRRATAVLEQVDDLMAATRDIAAARAGTVTLGVIPTAAGVMVPHIATRLRELFPGVELIIQEAGSTTIAALVADRRADVGLARLPLGDATFADHIESEELLVESLVLAVPRGHRFATRTAGVAIAELRDEPLMLVRRDQGTLSDLVLDACAAAGFAPRLVCEGAEIDTLLRLVAAGVGCTIVPATGPQMMPHLAADIQSVPIRVMPDEPALRLTLGLLWRRHGYRSQAASALAAIIREAASNSSAANPA